MATDFLKLSKEAYEAACGWFDTNQRGDLDYSLRAFRNEHASGSKYLSEDYKHRSRLFRPKTRSVIRKNEAAGAVALFSNMETAVFTPGNPDDPRSRAGAAMLKELVEYRMSRTIPAFPLVMGALQDAQTTGAVVSYQYWEYEQKNGKTIKDQPCISLRPIENMRIDGGADWIDPVGTTPYLCDIIPMYVCQVRGMMETKDPKTGGPKWKKYDDNVIMRARPSVMEATRIARQGKGEDPSEDKTIREFETVWVMRWFMRDRINDDYTYYTLGTEELLTTPTPLQQVYFHGKRPYVMGCFVLESHKTLKTSMPSLLRPIQQESNEIANQRIDNVKFVLNKRWLVARGRQADVQSLVRNIAGGVTLTTDPKTDIVESNWPDVTSSSYVEQDRLNADFDDLAGNFSPSTKFANKGTNDTLGGARLASQGAGLITDYGLRTFIETWYEPVLRQMVLLEREYETDEVVLGICGNKARLARFGVYGNGEDLLNQEVGIAVNVGMGTSNPTERFQKLIMGTNMVMDTITKAPPNFNVQEFTKEAYSNMGYRDGSRFWSDQADPRLMKALQMVQQLQQALNGKQMELQANGQLEQQKLLSNERVKAAELQVDLERIGGDLHIRAAELMVEQQRLDLEKLKMQVEVRGMTDELNAKLVEAGMKLEESHAKLEHERMKINALAVKTAADLAKTEAEAAAVDSNEKRISGVAEGMAKSMKDVGAAFASIQQDLAGTKKSLEGSSAEIVNLKDGLRAIAGVVAQPKRKAKSFKLKKKDKKTQAVIVEYDDGSNDEMKVMSEGMA